MLETRLGLHQTSQRKRKKYDHQQNLYLLCCYGKHFAASQIYSKHSPLVILPGIHYSVDKGRVECVACPKLLLITCCKMRTSDLAILILSSCLYLVGFVVISAPICMSRSRFSRTQSRYYNAAENMKYRDTYLYCADVLAFNKSYIETVSLFCVQTCKWLLGANSAHAQMLTIESHPAR